MLFAPLVGGLPAFLMFLIKEAPMARTIWSGSISFGLVNVPIRLHSATRDRSVHLHLVTRDEGCRVRRKLVCPSTGEEVDYKETARGYEVAPDQYVIIGNDELENLKPEAARTMEIRDFVDLNDIDPVYYDNTYYITPDKNGTKAYQLLLQAMRERNKVAICRFVMRTREYLGAIRPMGNVLVLETMRHADEVVAPSELDLPKATEVDAREVEMAERLIAALEGPFEPEKYHDEYREALEELIQQKAAGQEVVAQPPAAEEAPRVINLMEALEQSLQQARKDSRKEEPSGKKAKKKGKTGRKKTA
jgi:DNA end-binding protein Ku